MRATPKLQNTYPPWSPRIWNGMTAVHYWKLLLSNRLRIHPLKWPMTALGTFCSTLNSLLRPIHSVAVGGAIRRTELVAPPIFIIGHWRSGTTLLHELLALDDNVAFPATIDAFIPNHLMLSRFWLAPLVSALLPRRRPMDDMSISGSSPQEDDFALVSLGAPTPYLNWAFPNHRGQNAVQIDPELLSAGDLERLHQSLDYFYRLLTMRTRKRLVLKSPPHTARVAQLAEWFPGSRFVHLSRHPYQLVESTAKLWLTIDATQGFQLPRYSRSELQMQIHRWHKEMYRAYYRSRKALLGSQLLEIKFEDLIAKPLEVTGRLLSWLDWPDAGELQSRIDKYFQTHQDIRPSKAMPTTDEQAEIDREWSEYCSVFRY